MEATSWHERIVVVACAVSAGAHGGLIPDHLEEHAPLGVAFIAATLAAIAIAAALALRPGSVVAARAAALLLAGLIAAYALAVTSGIPWLTDGVEPIDAIGVATKAAEALGLAFALPLTITMSGRRPLAYKEARS